MFLDHVHVGTADLREFISRSPVDVLLMSQGCMSVSLMLKEIGHFEKVF